MRIAAITVVALLGLGLWWLVTSRGDTLPSPVRPEPNVPPAVAPAVAPVAAPGDEPQAPAREAVPDAEGAAQFAELTVRVIDATSRAPVADADVIWSDTTLLDVSKVSVAELESAKDDEETFLRKHGRTTKSDANGVARLRVSGSYRLVGRAGSRFGQASGIAGKPPAGDAAYPGELLLELDEDHTLVVHVVDEQRQPAAGVPVALRSDRRPDGTRIARKLGVTDGAGRVVYRHAQGIARGAVAGERAWLLASIAGGVSEAVAIDLGALPRDPVEVVVPSFGSVEFTLLGFDGAPWPHVCSGASVRIEPDWQNRRVPFDANGKAVVTLVRCGHPFVASGWFDDQPFTGPSRGGERTEVTLRMNGVRVVTGRLLDADGGVASGEAFLRFDGGEAGDHALRVDADGRFFEPVSPTMGEQPLLHFVVRRAERTAMREAKVTLRGPLVNGLNDVGDVVVADAPLLVAGEVVSTDPSVRPDALQLRLQRRDEPPRSPWRDVEDMRVAIGTDGRFAVRMPAGSTRWRLMVRGPSAAVDPIEFTPGTNDLRITVDPPSFVAATFVADPALAFVTVWLTPQFATRPVSPEDMLRRPGRGAQLLEDGDRRRAEWKNLAAGPWRFTVECSGQPPVIDVVVDVPRGGAANDARLVDIDLRGRVRIVSVHLDEPGGVPFAGDANVIVRGSVEPSARWSGKKYEPKRGEGVRFALAAPADLLVLATGMQAQTLPGVFSDVRVTLAPAAKFTVALDAPAVPEGVTARLYWFLADWPADGPIVHVSRLMGSFTGATALLGEGLPVQIIDGRASGVCCAAVPMRATLQLRRSGGRAQYVDLTPARIDPTSIRDGQVIELRADPAGVAQALAQLGG